MNLRGAGSNLHRSLWHDYSTVPLSCGPAALRIGIRLSRLRSPANK